MRSSPDRWADLFLMLAGLFGAIVRFAPTVIARSPINDGGMFYAMIEDLKANGFLLPAYTSYNHLNIPFAYPPLSLYIGALLSGIGVPTVEIMRWLPPLVSTLSIPAFYWMTSTILSSRTKASLATVAYALLPRSFSWYVMGGGLSRTFGVLFLLLACGSAWMLFSRHAWQYLLLTAIFGAGAVLSHPETGLHTASTCLLIWVFKGRSKSGVRDSLLVALGVILLTSPWWATVLAQHGPDPFRSALSTGGHSGLFWIPWLTFNFAEERFVTLLTVLGLIGLAVACIKRDWFLPAWLLWPFIVEPRSATAIAALPLAILAGCGLADFVIPKVASLGSSTADDERNWTAYVSQSRAVRIIVAYVLFSAFLGAYSYDLSLAQYVIPQSGRSAMQWIQDNSAPNARFVVLTGSSDPFSDPAAEWFPVLARRTSENTIQGQEWTLGRDFMPFLNSLASLQACLNQSPACVEDWASTYRKDFDYLYLEKPASKDAPAPSKSLDIQLRQNANYIRVFENETVAIFERR